MEQLLVLRSPADGIVMGCPRVNEVGKVWEKGQDAAFCTVGDPRELQVVMPGRPADLTLLRECGDWLKAHDQPLPATVRVKGRDSKTWQGKLEPLPESDAKEVPQQLTFK